MAPMNPEQERELLQRIQHQRSAFGEVFDLYYKPIFRFLYRRTGNYDLASDMAAETFLKAFLKIHTFVWKGISISSWLYRIASNEANQYARKKRYRPLSLDNALDAINLQFPDSETVRAQLEEEMKSHREFLKIQHALEQLDVKYQEVISLRFFERKPIQEIAEILNKPEGTIKSLLSRGLDKLRTSIHQ